MPNDSHCIVIMTGGEHLLVRLAAGAGASCLPSTLQALRQGDMRHETLLDILHIFTGNWTIILDWTQT